MELNEEEIKIVENKAKHSILMHNPWILQQFTKDRLDIMKISPKHKLILIQGDKDTGYRHIVRRHNPWQFSFSKLDSKYYIEPSKFSKDIALDYLEIAEMAFENGINLEFNKFPERFDLFRKTIENRTYQLLLYKNTKIVHTLYPDIKTKQRLKSEWRRGELIVNEGFEKTVVEIPYFDIKDEIKYSIHLTILRWDRIEKWMIKIFQNKRFEKYVDLGEKKFISNDYREYIFNRVEEIKHRSLSNIEKVMHDIDSGKIS